MFHADIADEGLRKYERTHPAAMVEGVDYGTTADPTGTDREVAWFDSTSGLSHGTPWPRASVETDQIIQPGQEYWTEFSVYLPDDQSYTSTGHWSTIATGAYGAPYGGASPLSLMLVRPALDGPHVLRMGNDQSILGDGAVVPTGRWVTVTMNFLASTDDWVRMWLDTGEGSAPVRINGELRADMDVIRVGVNDKGANFTRIGTYGNRATRILFRDHAVATTEEAANIDGVLTTAGASAP